MNPSALHIAVVSINRSKYSETFIQDSFDSFPCRKTLLYGGYVPTHFTEDWLVEGKEIPLAKVPFWKSKPQTLKDQARLNLVAWLRKHRPDAVLAHYGPSGVMLADICQDLNIPLTVHFHGYDAYRSNILRSYGTRYPELFAKAAALVVVSEDMRRQILGLSAPPEKLYLVRYGVNVPSEIRPLPDGSFAFAFVGRFVPKKSPELLLQAFARVVARHPEVRLRMVGDGELLGICQNLVQELGLQANVEFLGVRTKVEVAAILDESHALVLPSQRTLDGDSEGTPLVVMEAAAAGRAVVATRHGGIAEVVVDGETGLLVAENDELALAEAMLRLVEDWDFVQRVAADGNAVHELAPDGNAVKRPEADGNLTERLGKNAHRRALQAFQQHHYHQNLWQLVCNTVRLSQNP